MLEIGTTETVRTRVRAAEVENRLNNRPRKRHGWKTPAEIYAQHLSQSDPTVATGG